MKIYQNISFAKQLIIYLVTVLIITFILILLALTNSVQQFIGSNAYNQTQTFAKNVCHIFEKEILKIESIPEKIAHIYDQPISQYASLPLKLLKTYPQLAGCSIHYSSSTKNSSTAIRAHDGTIKIIPSDDTSTFRLPTLKQIIRRNEQGGIWIYSQVYQTKTLAFCHPLQDSNNQSYGFLKLDFSLKTITDIIYDNTLNKYGYLFVMDSLGNYLTQPYPNTYQSKSPDLSDHHPSLVRKIMQGKTGCETYYVNDIKYFIYYAPLSYMHWRLGIICPYNEILNSSHQLYWIIFLCLGGGLLFLFIGIINIVHRLSLPLRQLAYTARQIADGQFNTQIPVIKSSNEITELYDSFRYMQHSLINYIQKLKISTAEQEQRNSEMSMARRIQQRFLPHHIELPPNIELAAELRQSREVGGDLYEFFFHQNRLYFAIGDVSGKGTPAALYMVSICKLFRYVARWHYSTATICNIINRQMCEDAEDDMYVTMFMGILDIHTGILTYTNAGHPYPLAIHENGETNFISKYPDVPIGVLEDHCFTEHTSTLHKNTSLLLYTDGITDAENSTGQFYGKEKLFQCVQTVSRQSPPVIIQTILENISQHIDYHNQSDDLTLLLIRYKGIP